MKKSILSTAAFAAVAVSAVAVAPTTSEAIPAFARQTGAACLSCHFQTFPAVTSFGRAFKMSGFTDVGEQALIEDEALSIPSVLNSTFVLRAQYVNTDKGGAKTTKWKVPNDAVMMIGGRVTSNLGAFLEIGFGSGGGVANWQVIGSYDLDGMKAGYGIYNAGFGPTGAIEISNVFGQHGGKLNGKALSAVENIMNVGITNVLPAGTGNTTSVAGWVGSESFLVQLAGVAMESAPAVVSPSFVPTARGVYIADLGDAELMIGGGIMSGTQTAVGAAVGVSAQFIDLQVQGEMGDMSYGVYADFVNTKTKGVNGVATNIFSTVAGNNAKVDGSSIRLEIKPTHTLMLGVGMGNTKETPAAGTIKNSMSQFALTYEIAQNYEFNAYYMTSKVTDTTVAVPTAVTTKTIFAEVEALM